MKHIIFAAAVAAVCGMAAHAADIVGNGDFLQGQYRWIADCRDQVLSAEFTDGELKIKRLKDGYARIYQDFAVSPGKYEFSFNVRMLTPKTVVHLWLIPKDGKNQFQEKNALYLSAYYSDDKLKHCRRTVEIPAGTAGARLCITVNGSQADAVIDDIKIEPKP